MQSQDILKKLHKKNIKKIDNIFKKFLQKNKAYYNETIDSLIKPSEEIGIYEMNIAPLCRGYPLKKFSSWIETPDGLDKILDFMDKNNIRFVNYENE